MEQNHPLKDISILDVLPYLKFLGILFPCCFKKLKKFDKKGRKEVGSNALLNAMAAGVKK
jgi:hypothetical protein